MFAEICMQGKRRKGSDQAVFYVSFISGLAAGSFGALVVTPLDGMSPAFVAINLIIVMVPMFPHLLYISVYFHIEHIFILVSLMS